MNKYVVLFILIITLAIAIALAYTLINIAGQTDTTIGQITNFLII